MPYTTRGLARLQDWAFRRVATLPGAFYVALVTEEGVSPPVNTAPTHATKTFSELNEITAGNGYTAGGFLLQPGGADFDALTEDDDAATVELSLKNVSWTASGGSIPASGDPARYVVICAEDDSSPEVVGDRAVLWYASLGRDRVATVGQALLLTGLDIRFRGGSMIKARYAGVIEMASSTSGSATITAVNMDKCRLTPLGTYYTVGTPTAEQMATKLILANSTTIQANRASNAGTVVVGYELIEEF